MSQLLPQCSPVQLLAIADGLVRGDDVLRAIAGGGLGENQTVRNSIDRELSDLGRESFAQVLRAVAAERQAADEARDRRINLVWTGPERDGAGTRDTAVVVRELFQSAEHDVIVAGYALFNSRPIFEPLVDRMIARPNLRVRLFLNVASPAGSTDSERTAAEFGRRFLTTHWPMGPVPELYYDPRSIADESERRAVLHAKCVVVDDARTFITSANITEAAQKRNIELGVVIKDPTFAALVRSQFAGLVEDDIVQRLDLQRIAP